MARFTWTVRLVSDSYGGEKTHRWTGPANGAAEAITEAQKALNVRHDHVIDAVALRQTPTK